MGLRGSRPSPSLSPRPLAGSFVSTFFSKARRIAEPVRRRQGDGDLAVAGRAGDLRPDLESVHRVEREGTVERCCRYRASVHAEATTSVHWTEAASGADKVLRADHDTIFTGSSAAKHSRISNPWMAASMGALCRPQKSCGNTVKYAQTFCKDTICPGVFQNGCSDQSLGQLSKWKFYCD
jgi:hypothetical protein